MSKNYYKELAKGMKPAKSNFLMIKVDGETVYLCNGHWIVEVTKNFYDAFLSGKAVYLPVITSDRIFLEIRDKAEKKDFDRSPDFKKMFDIGSNTTYTAQKSPLCLDTDKGALNTYFWNVDGEIFGAAFDSKYIKMVSEFGNSKMIVINPKSPAFIFDDDIQIKAAVLPVYMGNDSELAELLKSMNAELAMKKRIKDLEKKNRELENALMNYKETETTERIKSNYKRGLITFSEAAECISDETKTA